YNLHWFVVNAVDYGVPQDRKEGFLISFKNAHDYRFQLPEPTTADRHITVGEALHQSMAARGWPGAAAWASFANRPAPTLVGGSLNRGGPDLGPTGSKSAWARLGVDGRSLENN